MVRVFTILILIIIWPKSVISENQDCLIQLANFAKNICGEIVNQGRDFNVDLFMETRPEVGEFLDNIFKLKTKFGGKGTINGYTSVLREKLHEDRQNVRECGLRIVSDFKAYVCVKIQPSEEVSFFDCDSEKYSCPEMIPLPTGSFQMGSFGMEKDEEPSHPVIVSAFAIGKYEVTFAEWSSYLADLGRSDSIDQGAEARGRFPVNGISWSDIREYLNWLSSKTGENYRLPTEAEWEYAARAGTSTRFAFGDMIDRKEANFSSDGPTKVDEHTPNAWGIHDMHGNLWEWVEDHWHDSYEGAPTDGTAWVSESNDRSRVIRGGSWENAIFHLRSANRAMCTIDNEECWDAVGFRVARSCLNDCLP